VRSSAGGTPLPSFWELYWKVIVAVVIWGIGTAAGEIPPYQFSYMAAVAGETNAELAAELEETKQTDNMDLPYSVRKFNAMKAWMVDFIERHGFWGVYAMSAWPNAAFDLCGMCCGSFKMPFWTFFGGTVLGKGFTLRPIQTAIFVGVFFAAVPWCHHRLHWQCCTILRRNAGKHGQRQVK